MTLISNKRQYFVRQYGSGTGKYYRTLHGSGVFLNSLKKLGKLFSQGLSTLYTRAKPKAIQFLKDSAATLKPKIVQTLKRASESAVDALISGDVSGIPKRLKSTVLEGRQDLLQNLKDSVPEIKRKAEKAVFDIAHGSGLRLSSISENRISQLLK